MFKYSTRPVIIRLTQKGVKAYRAFYVKYYGIPCKHIMPDRNLRMSESKVSTILNNDAANWSAIKFYENFSLEETTGMAHN